MPHSSPVSGTPNPDTLSQGVWEWGMLDNGYWNQCPKSQGIGNLKKGTLSPTLGPKESLQAPSGTAVLDLVKAPMGWEDHSWWPRLLFTQLGTSCKGRERLQESPFQGTKKHFWKVIHLMKAVICDLRRPKLAARTDSSWTHCCNGFLSLVSCPPKMSTLPVLPGWCCQALGPPARGGQV